MLCKMILLNTHSIGLWRTSHKSNEPVPEETTIWVPTMSDINRPVQSQKQARSLKFRI